MSRTRTHCRQHALTLVGVLVIIVSCVIAFALTAVMFVGYREPDSRLLKDFSQVRGVQQAMANWASMHQGSYPLPSRTDLRDATVRAKGTSKDTTANIYSLLVFSGMLEVESLVSPAEANRWITRDDDYSFAEPPAAVRPALAVWDPSFSADFTGGDTGNASYAHILPGGGRGRRWTDTLTTTEPVVGNRGPEVRSVTREGIAAPLPVPAQESSLTFLIHGDRRTWEGVVAYNDGHYDYETTSLPRGVVYKDASGSFVPDCIFFDEPDDARDANAWMSIWTTAGDSKGEFTPIWD
jgi:hypothetical protein